MTCQRDHVAKLKPCRWGCGTTVVAFLDELGCHRQIGVDPLPITVDLKADEFRRRLWEDRGRHVGWTLKDSPVRTWRELRLEHECANTPERNRKSVRKQKNEKENTHVR